MNVPRRLSSRVTQVRQNSVIYRLINVHRVRVLITIVTRRRRNILPNSNVNILLMTSNLIRRCPNFLHHNRERSSCHRVLRFNSQVNSLSFTSSSRPTITRVTNNLTRQIVTLVARRVVVQVRRPTINHRRPIIPCTITRRRRVLERIDDHDHPITRRPRVTTVNVNVKNATKGFVVRFVNKRSVRPRPIINFIRFLRPLYLLRRFLQN